MHIGQKVVCVNGYTALDGEQLIKGKTYTIMYVCTCKCELMVYVGIKTARPSWCDKCKTNMGTNGEWWHYGYRFAPLEEKKEHDKAVEQLFQEFELQPSLN